MTQNNNRRTDLFATSSTKTYAPHAVWKDSARNPVRFVPLGANRQEARRAGARLWHNARRFDRQTRKKNKHGGAIGQVGLRVLYVMLFDFIDHATGRLDPSYETIARVANVSVRSVSRAIQSLRAAGIINWIRRVYEKETAPGSRWEMAQDTNAYSILPATQWKGFHVLPDAPRPEAGSCGEHPPIGDALARAVQELKSGAKIDAALATLDQAALEDGGDNLATVLARMIRNRNK